MNANAEALERLAAVDAVLRAAVGVTRTLDPGGERAHLLREVGAALLADLDDSVRALAFADALAAAATSQFEHFPENIFWDLDHVAAVLLRATRSPEGPAQVARLRDRMLELHRSFGRHSSIRFRYAHDFVYGLDWEKWVAHDPDSRASIAPFDVSFLAHMRERAHEIARAIRHGNPRYPPLADGVWRNPFGFSREPEHEIALHRDLAARDVIPVAAWRVDAVPDWRRGCAGLRVERAKALGIPTNGA